MMELFNFLGTDVLRNLSFANLTNITLAEYFGIVKPLMLFAVGLTVYSLFIFHFYRFLARRDVLGLELSKTPHNFIGFVGWLVNALLYVFENLILTPLFVFFWFFVLGVLMILLTRNPSASGILITSVALVAAIRISAYYNENLSQDLAKMIPFALLGIFLVDASFFSIKTSLSVAKEVPAMGNLLVYYLLFVTLLEFVLRITHSLYSWIFKKDKTVKGTFKKTMKNQS